jgi:hypothetical protein
VPDPLDLDLLAARNLERRRLKAGATEGPWEPMCGVQRWSTGKASHIFGHGPRHEIDHPSGERRHAEARLYADADAQFIAHAKNDPVEADVDSLLAEVRRLMALIAEADRRTAELWEDAGEEELSYG